ncbi:LysE family translocator [Cellulophaga sp. E16_2]|uniref:Lysine exporter protein (LYSE/YGGA) n=1 Tax=Cellulophaga algicola (strain DSM 14237 / IC166 / ACAM 630) TaxID=688270 RepID=E6X9E8_CELAD|nr:MULTISPECIES: LysE family translocator [Cellulophaga]ADV47687.1 Lysine exporter protein (LYSE/YGGA) [Cellulophaga algicola DSM 14237]MBO0590053.1 LysE family translocator [Cellulophaga sp. E16_2]
MNYDLLYTFIIATAALAITPGPDIIYVLMQSVINGRKDGIATAFGLVSGCLIHTTLLAFGVSALIKENILILTCIKVFGALYLFYLAYKVFKSSGQIDLKSDAIPKKNIVSLFRQGFIMNVLNPKVTIFFLAFFPGFLFSDDISVQFQFYILGFIFILISFIVFVIIAILSGMVSKYIKSNKKVGFILKWMQIVVFIGIGVYLLFLNK